MTAPPDRCDPTALSIIRLTPEEYRKAIAEAEERGRADLRQVKDDLTKAWRSESAAKRGEDVLVDAFDKMIDAARAALVKP